MAKKGQDAETWVNTRKVIRYVIDDPLDPANNLDLTGKVVKWALTQIDPSTGIFLTTPTVIEKTTDTAGQIDLVGPATDGTVDVTIDAADMPDGFLAADYHMELEVFDGTPEGVVVSEGTLTVNPNVVNTL